MKKIFFRERFITISPEFYTDNCALQTNRIKPNSTDDIPIIVNHFESIHYGKANLWIDSSELGEENIFNRLCGLFTLSIAAGGLVQNPNNETLMIFRHNHWDLPKGRQENGEQIEETAIREVEEECGLHKLQTNRYLTETYHTFKENGEPMLKRSHWFSLSYAGNETPTPQLEEGITKAEWVDKSRLAEYIDKAFASVRDVFKAAKLL